MFKIKDGYKLELQTSETMKSFGSTKKLIDKTKTGENVQSLEIVEVVLVRCNLVDDQYQQKSEVLYTFTPNESYAYLLNVEPRNLVFLKTYNTKFDEIIITFTDQIEDKVNLTLLINKQKTKLIWHCLLINRNDKLFELSNATLFYRTKNEKICQRIWIFIICKKI